VRELRSRPRGGPLSVDVQIHGAGFIGLSLARALVAAGVSVRLVDPRPAAPAPASPVASGVVLGFHGELPWRFAAALGDARAGELVFFLRASLDELPGLRRVGVDLACEGPDRDLSRLAAARVGLRVEPTDDGLRLLDAGEVDVAPLLVPPLPVHAHPVDAEIDVLACGPAAAADPWLADKLMPVRWQRLEVPGLELPRPRVSRQASVYARTGVIWGARWATPHLEVGETAAHPEPRVTAALVRLLAQDHGSHVTGSARVGVVAESCDGLPIVGPIPGRPRVVACVGFGAQGWSWGPGAVRSVVDGLLGRPTPPLPPTLSARRLG